VKDIEDEIPFEVPEGWAWTKIEKFCFVTKLAGFEYTNFIADNLRRPDSCIPLFKGKNVKSGEIIYQFESFIPEEISDSLPRSQITKKCLLTPYVGAIGNIGIHNKIGKYHLGSNVGKIEILDNYSSLITEEFLKFYLLSSYGLSELSKHKKATAQESISIDAIRDVYVPIPPIMEQTDILNKIEEIFALIDSLKKSKTELQVAIKHAKSKILNLAIHGELVPQDSSEEPASKLLEKIRAEKEAKIAAGELKRDKNDSYIYKNPSDNCHYEKFADKEICIEDEIPFSLPNGWCWCRLKNIVLKLVDGDHNPPKGVSEETEYKMLSSRNINYNRIVDLQSVRYLTKETFDEENKRTQLTTGDILFTSVGSLGRSCLFNGTGNYCFQRSVTVVNTNQYNPYIKFCFDSTYYQKLILENATGTAQLGFYLEQMSKSLIPIPPFDEQKRIVSKITEITKMLDTINQALL